MDSQFAFVGSDFVCVVADTASVQQIIVQKSDEDKILKLDDSKLFALSGTPSLVHKTQNVHARAGSLFSFCFRSVFDLFRSLSLTTNFESFFTTHIQNTQDRKGIARTLVSSSSVI